MSDEFDTIKPEEPKQQHATVSAYVMGFVLSLLLTLTAYFLVSQRLIADKGPLISVIMGLAIIQMCVQLFFFLHLGSESKPRWNLQAFLFMTLVTIILILGSLWIMYTLDDRVMPMTNKNLLDHQTP
jgi:cytochrome o ubiquinol oxidase subunit IV